MIHNKGHDSITYYCYVHAKRNDIDYDNTAKLNYYHDDCRTLKIS